MAGVMKLDHVENFFIRTEPYVSCKYVNNLELVNGFTPVGRFLCIAHGIEVRGRLIVVKGMLTFYYIIHLRNEIVY